MIDTIAFCKYLLPLLTVMLMAACGSSGRPGAAAPITVMSYNIKYDNKADTINGWDQRKKQIVNLLSFYEPDFIGTQEALLHQLEYLETTLTDLKWIGVGRTDGDTEGEFSALVYNSARFELVEDSDSTVWLSETPGRPVKGWDAALPRIMTWGQFTDKNTGKKLVVFNTHFDHVGDTARTESARLIVDTIQDIAGDLPVILTGDFNATENSLPYSILTGNNSGLNDAYYESELPHIGPAFSFEGFEVLGGDSKRRIDYIFVNEKVDVLKHAFISDFRNGRYPSDHLPVIAEVTLE